MDPMIKLKKKNLTNGPKTKNINKKNKDQN